MTHRTKQTIQPQACINNTQPGDLLKELYNSTVDRLTENKESLEAWEKRMEAEGYKITKDNKTATYHAWDGTKHISSYRAHSTSVHEAAERDMEELQALLWDLYKEEYGVRPRHWSQEEWNDREFLEDQLRQLTECTRFGQLDELSQDTLKSYVKKANKDSAVAGMGFARASGNKDNLKPHVDRITKRQKGVDRAVDRLGKKEQLDELSQDTLKSYAKNASVDRVRQGAKWADYVGGKDWVQRIADLDTDSGKKGATAARKMNNRTRGIDRAADRLKESDDSGKTWYRVQMEKEVSGSTDPDIPNGAMFTMSAEVRASSPKEAALKAVGNSGYTVVGVKEFTPFQPAARPSFDELRRQDAARSKQGVAEQLDELSQDTLKSYVKKANKDSITERQRGVELGDTESTNRVLNELSKETLSSYFSKALGSKSSLDFARGVKMALNDGNGKELLKKSDKRSTGIHTAAKKLAKSDKDSK